MTANRAGLFQAFNGPTSGTATNGAITTTLVGLQGQGVQSDSGAVTAVIGGQFLGQKIGTGAVTTLSAGNFLLQSTNATGTVTTMRAANFGQLLGNQVTTGTITNPIMVEIGGWNVAGGPTYTNPPEQLRLADGAATNGIGLRQIGSAEVNSFNGNVRFGADTSPGTAYADFAASTTSSAQVNFEAGTAPTAPVDGDLWHDSTIKNLIQASADLSRTLSGTFWRQYATVAVSNTTTETTMTHTGRGTRTLPANFLVLGRAFRVVAGGSYSTTDLVAATTFVIRLKLGGATLITSPTVLSTANTAGPWRLAADCVVTIVGASGAIVCTGLFTYANTQGGTPTFTANYATTGITVDTTGTLTWDVTAQLATTVTSADTISMYPFTIQAD